MVLKKTLESPLDCKDLQPVHPKGDQSWVFIGRIDVEAETPIIWPPDCEELTLLIRPWCWERLRAGVEEDDRGWNGWMASLTQWTWIWVDSGSWWWTGRSVERWFMGSQRVRNEWATELNWTELNPLFLHSILLSILSFTLILQKQKSSFKFFSASWGLKYSRERPRSALPKTASIFRFTKHYLDSLVKAFLLKTVHFFPGKSLP